MMFPEFTQHTRDLRMSLKLGFFGGCLLGIALATSPVSQPAALVLGAILCSPLLCFVGFVTLLYLSRWKSFLTQFARFCIVGFVSSSIEIALINVLFTVSGHYDGVYFTVFKALTFTVALFSGYFFNRMWTFEGGVGNAPVEFIKYIGVNCIGILINVSTASLVVNIIQTPIGVSDFIWSNFGVLVAVFVTMLWNFVGYKFFVFQKPVTKLSE